MREKKCLNVVLKARWWQNSVFEWISRTVPCGSHSTNERTFSKGCQPISRYIIHWHGIKSQSNWMLVLVMYVPRRQQCWYYASSTWSDVTYWYLASSTGNFFLLFLQPHNRSFQLHLTMLPFQLVGLKILVNTVSNVTCVKSRISKLSSASHSKLSVFVVMFGFLGNSWTSCINSNTMVCT